VIGRAALHSLQTPPLDHVQRTYLDQALGLNNGVATTLKSSLALATPLLGSLITAVLGQVSADPGRCG
jgi:hypothetical protein